MESKISLLFYKNLLYADFNLLSLPNQASLKPFIKHIQLKITGYFVYLNLFESLKTFKQFIRLLQFLKVKRQSRVVLKILNGSSSFFLVQNFLAFYKISFQKIQLESANALKKKPAHLTFFYIFLGTFFSSLIKHLFIRRINLILSINLKIKEESLGFYKLYNDVLEFQKIIFLLIFLKKIYV